MLPNQLSINGQIALQRGNEHYPRACHLAAHAKFRRGNSLACFLHVPFICSGIRKLLSLPPYLPCSCQIAANQDLCPLACWSYVSRPSTGDQKAGAWHRTLVIMTCHPSSVVALYESVMAHNSVNDKLYFLLVLCLQYAT